MLINNSSEVMSLGRVWARPNVGSTFCGRSESTFVFPAKPLITKPLITTNVPLLIKPQTQPSLSLITLSSPFPPLAAPRQPSAGRGQPARSRASLDVAGAARGEPGNVGAWPILAGFTCKHTIWLMGLFSKILRFEHNRLEHSNIVT